MCAGNEEEKQLEVEENDAEMIYFEGLNSDNCKLLMCSRIRKALSLIEKAGATFNNVVGKCLCQKPSERNVRRRAPSKGGSIPKIFDLSV